LVGAFVAAFHIDNWTSFEYNIIPILFFMIICFVCKSEIQVSTTLAHIQVTHVIRYFTLPSSDMEFYYFIYLYKKI
jgi:hypothetical protein